MEGRSGDELLQGLLAASGANGERIVRHALDGLHLVTALRTTVFIDWHLFHLGVRGRNRDNLYGLRRIFVCPQDAKMGA
jgi:hypothetical protein